jgi:Ca2+-binding RTX toxin-like protein
VNLTGNDLNNLIYAGTGDNVLDGGAGTDTVTYAYGVTGSTGVTVSLATVGPQATGGSGTDTVLGIEHLTGSANADRLTGNGNANSLTGGAGNDTLDGGSGADTLSGGDGNDFYYVDHAGDVVSETNASAAGGTDLVFTRLASYTLTAHVENARILATGAANLTGNDLDNLLYAGTGDNVLNGGAGNDTVTWVSGVTGPTGVTASLAIAGAQATGGSGYRHPDQHRTPHRLGERRPPHRQRQRQQPDRRCRQRHPRRRRRRRHPERGRRQRLLLRRPRRRRRQRNQRQRGWRHRPRLHPSRQLHPHGPRRERRILATGAANLTGNDLNNLLYAGTGDNVLNGGAGNDTVTWASGVTGSTGVTASLAIAGAQATGGSGTDTLISIEHLIGSANADRLTGNAANNKLEGQGGNDTLDGGGGADTLSGGDGNDFYYVDHVGDVISETSASAAGGTDLVFTRLASYTLTAHVENARILATGAANLTGNDLNNLLYAGTGDNVLNGGTGNDTVTWVSGVTGSTGVTASLAIAGAQATGGSGTDTLISIEHLIGSANADRLTGNGNANSLSGGAGNDTLDGGSGADTLSGGDGNDFYYVDHAGDVVSETNASAAGGSDLVFTRLASYTLTAHVENGRILATGTANLTGNDLNNLLYAGTGDNVLNGGAGNDIVTWAYGVTGSTGVTASLAIAGAQATGGSGTDTLIGIEHLIGSANADRLTGNGNANSLTGGAGNDTLDGGGGADLLAGGLGNDVLSGGLGADIFRFDTLPNVTTNRDTISDFNVFDDSLQFENAVFSSLAATGTLAAGSFRSGAGFSSATDADDYLIYDSSSGALYYDANGNAGNGPVQIASLASGLALSSLDFLVT